MFRDAQAALLAETRAFADGRTDPTAFGPRFRRLAGFMLGELEAHHTVEDVHYFPRLAALEPRLQRGFELLDADHHILHDRIAAVSGSANALLTALTRPAGRERAARDAADGAAAAVDGLGALLDRHLADEEDIVAPILAKHGEARLG